MLGAGLPFSWFDLVVLVALYLGYLAGARRGMTLELLDLLQWLAVVWLCAKCHRPLGWALASFLTINPSPAFVWAYLLIAAGVVLVFQWIRLGWGDFLQRKERFGKWENVLGIAAGMVRTGCIVLVLLAVLHGKHVDNNTSPWLAAEQTQDPSGSVISRFKSRVFSQSLTGRLARRAFHRQLIHPEPPVERAPSGWKNVIEEMKKEQQ